MTRRWILPSALLLAAGAGAAGMAIELASLYVSDPSGRIVVAPYALGAVLFLASAWLQRSDERRARLLGIAAAFLVASWVVGVGYGGRELASSAIAVLGVIAALSALTGLSARWLLATLLLFVGAGAALTYVALQHPPLGLVAVYAVGASSASAAALALLPRSVFGVPIAAAIVAVVAWVGGAAPFLLAYGVPLAAS